MNNKITFIVSSESHPINAFISEWIHLNKEHDAKIIRSPKEAKGGDICFLISCTEIVSKEIIQMYRYCLVIHASDLPLGRGWSPHIWNILNNENEITVSLLEASEKVDTGRIWKKLKYKIEKYFLYEEIISIVNKAHLELIDYAVNNQENIQPMEQDSNIKPTYFPKRTPEHSEIFIDRTLKEQFNLLRVCDNKRFPAFFKIHGHKYKILIEKYDDKKNED